MCQQCSELSLETLDQTALMMTLFEVGISKVNVLYTCFGTQPVRYAESSL